ncbi:DNA pilot protein [Peromfec virus RodF8_47]|uniref:DNA pilot protein n=1 Tax=Peromfec virus RodF8_47 TaxID=2929378 RepID=A0A976N2D8_9VIRU|nr:DNA pilot protein [Peromfec virus RodF8_47]
MDLGLGSLIGGAVSGLGSLFAGNAANRTNLQIARETNQNQLQIAREQAQYNKDLWDANNAYNTPLAQMQRYEEAGLNPHLIYGNGSSSAGNSSSPAAGYDTPRLVNPTVNNQHYVAAGNQLMQGLMQAAQVHKLDADTALAYQNVANAERDNQIKELEIIRRQYENSKTKDEADMWRDLLYARMSNLDASTTNLLASAQLSDERRFTSEALRPAIVEEQRARINNILANTDLAKSNKNLNGFRSQLMIAQIADTLASAKLKGTQQALYSAQLEIKNILIHSGLNIESDELDRLLYQFTQADEDAVPNWFKAAKIGGQALGKIKLL